jgi:carboxylesterase
MDKSNENTTSLLPGAKPFRFVGNGAKTLLIHGFTASPTEVRPVGEYLNKKFDFDVYSVLLEGHGTKPEDLRKTKWQDWYQSAEKAFLDIEECSFVLGLSTGGLLACHLAVNHTQSIKKIVLLSTPTGLPSKILPFLPIIKLVKPYLKKGQGAKTYFEKHNLTSYHEYPLAAVQELNKLIKFSRKHIIPKVNIPTLVIQGQKEDTIDPKSAQILHQLLPHDKVQLHYLPNSKHIVTVEPDQKELLESVGAFLTAL